MKLTSARLHVGMMLLVLIVPTFQRADVYQDPGAVLDRASASFDTVRTLQADFVQIVDNPMLGSPDTTRGRLYQRRPSYFAMRFSEPQHDRIVADGRRLWLYTPSTTPDQVIRTTIPGTGTTGPNLIGQFVEHPRERYTARYVRADSLPDGAVDVVALTPRAQDLPYSEATVWIAKQDGLVRRIDLVENTGQRRTITLQHLTVNGTIPPREFRFSPTSGVRVVDQ
ncbi:MAG: outer membrane lipoprotein carrier protein LolA [Gemmatimonadetes bacterium]|nr:MAG: outer membrane lipoprotein carrier protein LolA [Gemmatimonadota bacterium]